ncbi:CAP domain-containing protein, partial [Aliicoccus persicus]
MENKRIFGFRKIAGVLVACAIGVSVYTDASAQDQNSIIYQTMGGQEIEITVPWEFEEGVDEESVDLTDNPFFTGDEDVREDTASSYISNLGEEQTYMENHLNTINSVREERGLEPLQLDEELIKLAQIKAADMAENQYFDHDRPGTGSIGQQYSYFLTEPGDKNPENFSVSIAMFSSDSNDPDAVQEEIYDLLTDDNGLSNSITSDFYNSFGVAFYHDEENDIYFGVQLFHTDPVEDEDAPDNGEDVPEDGEETDDNGEDTPEDGEETDDNGEDVPEDGEETDDNGDDTPEDGEDIEDNGDDTPEDGEDTEDNGEDTPEDGQDFTRADAVINYSHVERTLEFQDQENVQGIQLFTSLNGEPVDIFNASDVSDTLNFSLPFDGFEVDRVYHERLGHDITFETTTDDAGNQVIQIRTPDLDNEDYIFLVQTATENPLADAITAATETVNGLENLSDEQRQQFISQIESAESEEAINTIVSEAQAADDSAAPDPLADVKTAAVETVNGLEFLSDEQTQEFLTQIETAESEEAINSIVSEAQAANSENDSSFEYADINLRYQFLDLTFNQYDDREYQTIELVPTVDEEAVNPFDASDVDDTYTFNIRFDEFPVTDILNVDNANPIPFEVVDSDDGQVLEVTINSMSRLLLLGDEIDQFASIRESARSQVAELVNLNEEQVAEFNTQIDEAETEDAINAVVSDARSLNEEQTPDPLADDKNAAKETVGALEHLNEEQVSAFNTQIDDAESVDAINAVVSEAEAANEEQTPDPLADEKTVATETVNALEFLSDEEKSQFNEQIESAETADAINTVVSEAETLNSENDSSFEYADITLRYQYLDLTFNQYENREYQTIELVPTVDEEPVNPFDATDVEDTYTFTIRFDEFEVTDIVNVDNANPIPFEVVDSEDGQVLEVTIDSMSRLLILGEEIDQFASIRESAREQVAKLEYLNEEQVSEFNNQIDSAETEDAINTVVSDARSVNEDQAPDPLQDEKDAAEETVIGLEYLEEEQVTEFTTMIENAETEEVINSTVSEAQSVNEDQTPDPLQDEKDAAKETVGALEYLDEEQVTEFNNQIDNADSAEGINSVVSEAQSVNDEQAPDPLQDEKDAAKETVAGLEYLDEEQVTDFNNQIDNADSAEGINSVVSEAQSVNEDQTPDPLQDEKDAAKETV